MSVDILDRCYVLEIKNEVDHILHDEQNCNESESNNHRCSTAIFLVQQELVSVLDEFVIFLLFLSFAFFQFFLFMLVHCCSILHTSNRS